MRSIAIAAVLACLACHDAGEDTLATGKAQYLALVERGTPPQSIDFDKVMKTLQAVPESSRGRAEAQKLIKAIESARTVAARLPLAVVPTPVPGLQSAELDATRAECAQLARELGNVTGEARAQKMELIDACRRRIDALVDALEHGTDGGQP